MDNNKSNNSKKNSLIQTIIINLESQINSLQQSDNKENKEIVPLSKIKTINIIIMSIFILLIIIDFFYSFYKDYYHFLSFKYYYTEKIRFQVHPFSCCFAIFLIILLLLYILYCMKYKSLFFKSFPNYRIIYGKLYPFCFVNFSLLIIIDILFKLFNVIESDDKKFTISDYFITAMIFLNTIIFTFIYIKIKKQKTKNVFLVIPQNIFISLLLSLSIYLIFFYFLFFIKSKNVNDEVVKVFINFFIFIYFFLDIYFLIVYKDIIFTIQSNILEIGLIEKSDNLREKIFLVIALLISFIGCFIYVKKYKKRVFGLQYNKNNLNKLKSDTLKNVDYSEY